jgi:hypothetical protein
VPFARNQVKDVGQLAVAVGGKPVPVSEQVVTLNMKRAETVLLRLEPAQ